MDLPILLCIVHIFSQFSVEFCNRGRVESVYNIRVFMQLILKGKKNSRLHHFLQFSQFFTYFFSFRYLWGKPAHPHQLIKQNLRIFEKVFICIFTQF